MVNTTKVFGGSPVSFFFQYMNGWQSPRKLA
jgi:hypothetical protein